MTMDDNTSWDVAGPALLDACQNMLGAFDTPIRRRKLPGSLGDEAIETARAAVALGFKVIDKRSTT